MTGIYLEAYLLFLLFCLLQYFFASQPSEKECTLYFVGNDEAVLGDGEVLPRERDVARRKWRHQICRFYVEVGEALAGTCREIQTQQLNRPVGQRITK